MRKLLPIYESHASDFDVLFNASKSNFIVVTSRDKRNLALQMNNCCFSTIGGSAVCRVDSYVHLGHIIDCQLNDNDDVIFRRNFFIGQSNTVLCYFNKFDLPVRTRYLKVTAPVCMAVNYGL